MAVNGKLYGAFIDHLAQKRIDIDSDTFKLALLTSAYTPDQDAHDFFNDLTNEVSSSGTGYTSGGVTLSGVTWGYTSGTNAWKFDAADVTIDPSTITARYGVIYDSTPGTAATNPLVGYIDFDGDIVSTGGPFVVTWDAAGIFTLTVG
jgi:hypothetical protein